MSKTEAERLDQGLDDFTCRICGKRVSADEAAKHQKEEH